jgi:hypothetical protein
VGGETGAAGTNHAGFEDPCYDLLFRQWEIPGQLT